jgi:hypothetical protein
VTFPSSTQQLHPLMGVPVRPRLCSRCPGRLQAARVPAGVLRPALRADVALCQGNASLCRPGAYVEMRAAGQTPMRGLAQPSTEMVWVYLCAPCVGLGFLVWLRLALRSLALWHV